jgi:hypothetical protein
MILCQTFSVRALILKRMVMAVKPTMHSRCWNVQIAVMNVLIGVPGSGVGSTQTTATCSTHYTSTIQSMGTIIPTAPVGW